MKGASMRKRNAAIKPYQPNAREQKALALLAERKASRPKMPPHKIAPEAGERLRLAVDHKDSATAQDLQIASWGLTYGEEMNALFNQFVPAVVSTPDKAIALDEINSASAMVAALQPQDAMEAMLCTQMVVTQKAAMNAAAKLPHAQCDVQRDSYSNSMNKLLRSFTAQVEALAKYRNRGQQKVTVEHVHVYQGGQAIVGNVQHGGGAKSLSEVQAYGDTLAYLPAGTMPSPDAAENPLPEIPVQRKKALPPPRRSATKRSAKGQ